MRAARVLWAAIMALVIGSGATACRTATPFEEEELIDTKVHLVVKNESINEMDIYAVASGVATRVGTVSALATKAFALDQSFYQSSGFRVDASPFGGSGRASTGTLAVSRGQTIEFTVRSTLRSSTVHISH